MGMEEEVDRLSLFTSRAIKSTTSGPPLYRVVEDLIRELISSGQLVPGDLIPSESQLARELDVSPGTVKKAITNLVWEKLLFRHQGKGTYVSRVDFEKSLFRFFSYGDSQGRSIRIHKKTTARFLQPGPSNVCRTLGVAENTLLVYIERVGVIGDQPILVEYSWWLASLVPGLEDENLYIPDYLYALILDRFGIPVVRAMETLTADAADTKTANIIGVNEGTPVIVLKRMTYTKDDRIVEVRTTKGRSDRFSYKTEIP
jgi:GntR family transcriptional regulator